MSLIAHFKNLHIKIFSYLCIFCSVVDSSLGNALPRLVSFFHRLWTQVAGTSCLTWNTYNDSSAVVYKLSCVRDYTHNIQITSEMWKWFKLRPYITEVSLWTPNKSETTGMYNLILCFAKLKYQVLTGNGICDWTLFFVNSSEVQKYHCPRAIYAKETERWNFKPVPPAFPVTFVHKLIECWFCTCRSNEPLTPCDFTRTINSWYSWNSTQSSQRPHFEASV